MKKIVVIALVVVALAVYYLTVGRSVNTYLQLPPNSGDTAVFSVDKR